MANRRREFEDMLLNILGTPNVYFQAPSTGMKYPCIKYKLDGMNTVHANNEVYRNSKRYQVTYIDKRPDSDVPDKLIRLKNSKFVRSYTADYLNHYVFDIYY